MTSSSKTSVIPLSSAIKEVLKEIDSREWEGDFSRSDYLQRELQHLRELEASGDVWYPLF